jgi:CubicO group peptidase (beta-lactamase class C family)
VSLLTAGAPLLASATADEEARGLRLVTAIATGDAARVLEAIHAEFAPSLLDKRPGGWHSMAERLASRHAGWEVSGVLTEGPHHLEITTRHPDANWRLRFDFDPEPPHRIASFGIGPDEGEAGGQELPPLELPASRAPEATAAALTAWFDLLYREHGFSGAALVVSGDRTLLEDAWGLADRRWGVPNRIDTRFDLGSINKSFTQILIGRLLADSSLDLDDTLAELLPEYPNPEPARKITVRHLLEHSSGLPDIFGPAFQESSKALYRTPRDYFPLFAGRELDFEPGRGHRYSNSGFMVLGAIIEAITGKPYPEVVEEWVFEPAGMTSAGFFARDEPVSNVAEGYTPRRSDGRLTSNVFRLPVIGSPAGSAYASVRDLLAFDTALRHHRLLSASWTAWYFGGPAPALGAGAADPEPAKNAVGIAGGAPGVSAVMESDGDVAVIVLSNFDPPLAENAGVAVYRALRSGG